MKNTVEKKSFPPDIFSNDHKCPNTEFQSEYKKNADQKKLLIWTLFKQWTFCDPYILINSLHSMS